MWRRRRQNAKRKISHFIDIILHEVGEKGKNLVSSPDPKWDWNTNSYWKRQKEHKALKDIKIPPIWIITISFSLLRSTTREERARIWKGEKTASSIKLYCLHRLTLRLGKASTGSPEEDCLRKRLSSSPISLWETWKSFYLSSEQWIWRGRAVLSTCIEHLIPLLL